MNVDFTKVFFVTIMLLFATSVLGISLVNASSSTVMRNDQPSSTRPFHFSQEVVPGHILYPLSVVRDKLSLAMMNDRDRCTLKLSLSQSRLDQAKTLLDFEDYSRALETFTKGYRYLNEVGSECSQIMEDKTFLQAVRVISKQYSDTLQSAKPNYSDTDRAEIDRIIDESEMMRK